MTARIVLCAALLGCAPTVRAAGRCPTLPAFAVDFAIGGAVLAYAVAENQPLEALPAGVVFLATNLSECR